MLRNTINGCGGACTLSANEQRPDGRRLPRSSLVSECICGRLRRMRIACPFSSGMRLTSPMIAPPLARIGSTSSGFGESNTSHTVSPRRNEAAGVDGGKGEGQAQAVAVAPGIDLHASSVGASGFGVGVACLRRRCRGCHLLRRFRSGRGRRCLLDFGAFGRCRRDISAAGLCLRGLRRRLDGSLAASALRMAAGARFEASLADCGLAAVGLGRFRLRPVFRRQATAAAALPALPSAFICARDRSPRSAA